MISIFLGVLHLFRQPYDTPLMHTLRCAFGIAWWRSSGLVRWELIVYGIMIISEVYGEHTKENRITRRNSMTE